MNVLKKSFQLCKNDLPKVVSLSIVISLCINVPLFFLTSDKSSNLLVDMLSIDNQQTICAYLVWMLSFILLSTLVVKFNYLFNQRPHSLLDCLQTAISQFFPLLLIAALYGIVVICGIVFLIVPGLILSVSLMFAFVIRLLEQRDIFDTLVESHKLVWGNWWYSLMMFSIPFLLHLFLLLLCIILVSGLMAMINGEVDHTLTIAFLANAALQVVMIPLILSLTVCMFYNLKSLSLKKHIEEL